MLDDLHRCLQEFSSHPGWPVKRWMIASTPLRMRLPSARRILGDLTRLGPFGKTDAVLLAYQLNDACRAANQRLRDIETCLGTLQDAKAPHAERTGCASEFPVIQNRLLAALSEIRRLIIQQFPGVPVERGTRGELKDELRGIERRLRDILDVYEENPGAMDSGLLSINDRAVDVRAAVIGAYRIMKTRVYAEDSRLRADHDVWTAFSEQRDEFAGFYRSALTALEIYREVLQTYSLVNRAAKPRPRRGDLKQIQQDKQVQVAERTRCIEAVGDFHSKFSAMLAILR